MEQVMRQSAQATAQAEKLSLLAKNPHLAAMFSRLSLCIGHRQRDCHRQRLVSERRQGQRSTPAKGKAAEPEPEPRSDSSSEAEAGALIMEAARKDMPPAGKGVPPAGKGVPPACKGVPQASKGASSSGSPPVPQTKGVGKGSPPASKGGKGGKGAPPAPPAGKGAAKGSKGPPPAGKGAAAAGKVKSKSRAVNAAETPLGRKMHFVTPMWESEEAEERVWSELAEEQLAEFNFSPELLAALFAPEAAKEPRKSLTLSPKKSAAIQIIDSKRAQNMAIVLARLPCSTVQLCKSLKDFDFAGAELTVDDIELVTGVLPTDEEIKSLIAHEDKIEELRDIEQKLLPFCSLDRGAARLNIMRAAVTHSATHSGLMAKINTLREACEECHRSPRLRSLLAVVLQMGNYINAARCDGNAMKGFSVESLPALATFKTGSISSLHFLCLTLRSSKNFLLNLEEDLQHLPEAARLSSSHLSSLVNSFTKDCVFVEGQANIFRGQEGHEKLEALATELRDEATALQDALRCMEDTTKKVQKFFGVVPKKGADRMPPVEEFLNHIAMFVEHFATAWKEIERAPAKWSKYSLLHQGRDQAESEKLCQQIDDARSSVDKQGISEMALDSASLAPRTKPRMSTHPAMSRKLKNEQDIRQAAMQIQPRWSPGNRS